MSQGSRAAQMGGPSSAIGFTTPKKSAVLGKRLAKDSGISSSEQNLQEISTHPNTASATPGSNFVSSGSTSLSKARMSVIKPTHEPGTLGSALNTGLMVADGVEVRDEEINLDAVKSLGATMAKSVSVSTPATKLVAEN